jgi:hypothetical protein
MRWRYEGHEFFQHFFFFLLTFKAYEYHVSMPHNQIYHWTILDTWETLRYPIMYCFYVRSGDSNARLGVLVHMEKNCVWRLYPVVKYKVGSQHVERYQDEMPNELWLLFSLHHSRAPYIELRNPASVFQIYSQSDIVIFINQTNEYHTDQRDEKNRISSVLFTPKRRRDSIADHQIDQLAAI